MNMVTLLSSLTMVCVVTSAFTWFLHAYNKGVPGTFTIAVSNTSFALGFGMITFRSNLSDFLSFIVANGLIAVGHILIIVGLQQFIGRRRHYKILIALFVIYMVGFCYWHYVEDNFRNRLILFLMTYASMMLFALTLTLSEYRKLRLKSYGPSLRLVG